MVTGLPFTWAVVTVFPCVLATTRVLPDEDGAGSSKSISMQSFLSLISTFIAMKWFSSEFTRRSARAKPDRIVWAKNQRAGNCFSSPSDSSMDEQLELLHFDCSRSLGTLLNFEADTIAFLEAFEAGTFDGAMVNKHIFAAILYRDESETLLVVEPLYSTLRHNSSNPSILFCEPLQPQLTLMSNRG